MAPTIPSSALVPVASGFPNTERLALAGFLAGYSGLTRQAYELDLRQFVSWCQQHQLHLFQAHRADIEFFARDLEARGRARATITRRLCTVAGFYRYADLRIRDCNFNGVIPDKQGDTSDRRGEQ
jgi:integrase/recombinase XerD